MNIPRDEVEGNITNIHEPEANNCFSIITQVIIEIPKQRIDRKTLNFNEQLRAQITWFNTSHGQNGNCFSHVFKRSASKKKVERKLELSQSQW